MVLKVAPLGLAEGPLVLLVVQAVQPVLGMLQGPDRRNIAEAKEEVMLDLTAMAAAVAVAPADRMVMGLMAQELLPQTILLVAEAEAEMVPLVQRAHRVPAAQVA